MTRETFCPKHFTLTDLDPCADEVMPCPPVQEVDPERHVKVHCGPCDRTRVIPIARVMQGREVRNGMCSLGECAAKVLLPEMNVAIHPTATAFAAVATELASAIPADVRPVLNEEFFQEAEAFQGDKPAAKKGRGK